MSIQPDRMKKKRIKLILQSGVSLRKARENSELLVSPEPS